MQLKTNPKPLKIKISVLQSYSSSAVLLFLHSKCSAESIQSIKLKLPIAGLHFMDFGSDGL